MAKFQDKQKYTLTVPILSTPPNPSKYLSAYSRKQSFFMQVSTRNKHHHLFLKSLVMKQKDSEEAGEGTIYTVQGGRVLYNYWHAVTVKQVNRITGRGYQLEPLKGRNAPSKKPNFLFISLRVSSEEEFYHQKD